MARFGVCATERMAETGNGVGITHLRKIHVVFEMIITHLSGDNQ